jgi:hypothetical protein
MAVKLPQRLLSKLYLTKQVHSDDFQICTTPMIAMNFAVRLTAEVCFVT